jgi:hypothetical protein
LTEPIRRSNIRRSPITRTKWDKMLAAYRERPTVKSVRDAGEVGVKVAKRAINTGWPDMNLPPFIELATPGTSVHKEMALMRESWQESAIVQGEAARHAAEESMAARVVMDAAMKSMKMSLDYAQRVMDQMQETGVILPSVVTPKTINALVKSMESAANIVEKAMKIERMRLGEPDKTLGIQIGIMLDRCTDEELESVERTGDLPARILGQREVVARIVQEDKDGDEQTVDVLAAEGEDERDDGIDEAGGPEAV